MTFDPERMKLRRASLGLSQYQLADESDIPRTMLSGYECGRHAPEVQALEALADALETSTDYLLGRDAGKIPARGTLEEAQAWAKAQGKTYCEHRGRAYRLRKDGWEPV